MNTIMFLALAGFFKGFVIDSIFTALLAAVIFGILNTLVKPILVLLSLPITVLTLGIFYFLINGLILYMTSALVSGFTISSYGLALLLSLIISLVNSYFTRPVYYY